MNAVETFWAEHQVGGPYMTLGESERALEERERMFPTLHELMPVEQPGKIVLDYGCGPGHDTILFRHHGASHVYYADASLLALDITAERLRLHGPGDNTTGIHVRDGVRPKLPTVDHVHCAGVLHHTTRPLLLLDSFRRALNPGGEIRLMVYSGDLSTRSQSEVPITRWFTRDNVTRLAAFVSLDAELMGSYPCSAPWRPDCFADCWRLAPRSEVFTS